MAIVGDQFINKQVDLQMEGIQDQESFYFKFIFERKFNLALFVHLDLPMHQGHTYHRRKGFYIFGILIIKLLLDSLTMASHTLPLFAHLQEDNYFNPIHLHLKKYTSNKNKQLEKTPHTYASNNNLPHTQKELRFKDLSKDRPEYYTQIQKPADHSLSRIVKKDSPMGSIRRKLFGNGTPASSREKSLSFSDVIKLSREKRLRQESRSKASLKKEGPSGRKEGKAFNALKARLLGQNNPNAGNIIKPPIPNTSKCNYIEKPIPPKPQAETLDLVRISTQLEPYCLDQSLQMVPL